MDKILERIIEADRQAREKVNAEKLRFETINDEIAAAKSECDKELSDAAAKEIEAMKAQMQKTLAADTARIDGHFSKTQAELNRIYDENREKWVQDIFNAVTK